MPFINIFNKQVQMETETTIYPKSILDYFTCPISGDTFKEPIVLPSGFIYDKQTILKWFSEKNTDPLTNIEIPPTKLKLIPVLNY